jgi:hypothetical protein
MLNGIANAGYLFRNFSTSNRTLKSGITSQFPKSMKKIVTKLSLKK